MSMNTKSAPVPFITAGHFGLWLMIRVPYLQPATHMTTTIAHHARRRSCEGMQTRGRDGVKSYTAVPLVPRSISASPAMIDVSKVPVPAPFHIGEKKNGTKFARRPSTATSRSMDWQAQVEEALRATNEQLGSRVQQSKRRPLGTDLANLQAYDAGDSGLLPASGPVTKQATQRHEFDIEELKMQTTRLKSGFEQFLSESKHQTQAVCMPHARYIQSAASAHGTGTRGSRGAAT